MSRSFVAQVWAGKSIGRILFNRAVAKHCASLSGRVIDLAGGVHPSYHGYLPTGVALVTTEYKKVEGVDLVVDIEKPLPFSDASESAIICFNAIYILESPDAFLKEIHRVLKVGGTLFLSSPFMTNEMPEPNDYLRFTKQGLERTLHRAGFSDLVVIPYGERGSAAMYLLDPIFHFAIVRIPFFLLGLSIDRLIPKRILASHPAPIGYFVVAKK